LAIKRKLVSQSPTFHFIADKVYILHKVADTHIALQQFEEADASISEIDATLPELRSLMKTDSDDERFVVCLYRLGDLYRLRNEHELALVQFNIGLERAYRLAANADTLDLKRHISLFLERLALLCETKADDKAALAYLLSCLELKEEIAKVSDGIQAFDDLAIIAEKIGWYFSKLGAREQAIKYYRSAWETRRLIEKCIGVKGEEDVKQAEANLNWARSLPIQIKLTVVQISPWVPPSEWLLPKPALAAARNMLCPCGSGKRYKHCHGKL
jgi:tetratricopeptide (TPR) repeat protein